MKTYQLFIFISLLLLGRTIGAASPTFGPEFNFTNDELIGAGRAAGAGVIRVSANEKMAQRFYEKVIEKCPECTYSQRREPRTFFSIRHPDDWSFEIALDPWVVEVHTDPMTTDQLRARQLEIQRLIFDTALELDLFSQDTSGHIHVGLLSAFDDDPKLFRNFIVDWTTYSRMASVLFGADSQGAPTMDMRGRHRLNNFRKIIAFFDQKLLNPEDERAFWVKVTKDIFLKKLSRFLDRQYVSYSDLGGQGGNARILYLANAIYCLVYSKNELTPGRARYQSLNLKPMFNRCWDQRTIELRSVHEVSSAAEYLVLAELIEGRINFLKKRGELIGFEGIIPIPSVQSAIDLFFQYSQEAGLTWNRAKTVLLRRYSHYVPSAYMRRCSGFLRDGWLEPVTDLTGI